MKDVGYFHNKFKEETLNADVLPWLFEKTENFVDEIDSLKRYPNSIIANYISEVAELHTVKVQEQTTKLNAIKEEMKLVEEAKVAEKARRRGEREAKRKGEEIQRLREEI